jgi:hypothetical protein
MKRVTVMLAVFMCTVVMVGASWAQDGIFSSDFTYQDVLDAKFTIRAGAWFQDLDGDFLMDESLGDTKVDLNDDLDLGDNDDFAIRLEFQPWQKHHIRLGYNGVEFDGNSNLNRQITVDGDVYALNTNVITDLEMDLYEIGYRYDLWRGETFTIAPVFQIDLIDFDVHIQDNPQTQNAEEDLIVPLPMIGIHGEYFPHPRFGAFLEVKGFTIGDTASVVDLEVGAQVNVLKNFSILGGYKYLYLDFDVSDVQGEITIDGPFIAGQIQF